MAIEFVVEKIDAVEESLKPFYKEIPGQGKFMLDVNGAIPKSEYEARQAEVEALQKLAKSPDGKTYKEMFEGAQTANKAIRQERDGFKAELGKWSEFGEVSAVHAMRDELEALKSEGKKATDLQQQINALKQANRELIDKENALKAKEKELTEINNELMEFKNATQRKLDAADAESQIAEVVDSIKEANSKALKRNLSDRYRAGDLVRDESGKLVSADGALSLAAYAKDTMEAYNLFNQSQPGRANPPSSQAQVTGGSKDTTIEAITKLFSDN